MRFKLQSGKNTGQQTGVGARLLLTLFFSIFFLMGSFFFYMLGKHFAHVASTYTWAKQPARILMSDVVRNLEDNEDINPYELRVSYEYIIAGKNYVKNTYSTNKPHYSSYEKAKSRADRFPVRSTVSCYVNPENPDEVILKHESLWHALFLFLPFIFIVIGGGGVYGTWSGSGSNGVHQQKKESIATKAKKNKKRGRIILLVLGIIFTATGIGFGLYFGNLFVQTLSARQWNSVQAKVLASDIIRNESTDSEGHTSVSYQLDVFYRYEVDNVYYKASRVSFISASSSNYSKQRDRLKKYRRGKQVTAYVDPGNPSRAVLETTIGWRGFLGLLPLVFLGVGLLLLRAAANVLKKQEQSSVPTYVTKTAEGPITLTPTQSRRSKLLGVIFFALFWNGIISVFLYQVYQGFQKGRPEWFLALFMVPFVLVGILSLFLVLYQFLTLFNPKVILTLQRSWGRPGETIEFSWKITGPKTRIQNLVVALEGREEATYQRGTDTITVKNTFEVVEIANLRHGLFAETGTKSFIIPLESMHSFEASNNKIVWSLQVKGDIPKWPDIENEYSFQVLPAEVKL